MPETPPTPLEAAMNARRLEFALNWKQLADAAKVSYEALRAIRRGDYFPSELTAQRLDRALQWEPGSIAAVIEGGEPTPLTVSQPAAGSDDSTQADAIYALLSTLPPEVQDEVVRRVQAQNSANPNPERYAG